MRRDFRRDLKRLGPRKLIVAVLVISTTGVVAFADGRIAATVAFTTLAGGLAALGFLTMEHWRASVALAEQLSRQAPARTKSLQRTRVPEGADAQQRSYELSASQLARLAACGFVELAQVGLERRRFMDGLTDRERSHCFFELARVVAGEDPERALELVRVSMLLVDRPGPTQVRFELDLLRQLGRHDEAVAVCSERLASAPNDPELVLRWAAARAHVEPGSGWDALNQLWRGAGLHVLAPGSSGQTATIEELGRKSPPGAPRGGTHPLVSAIVPVFEAQSTLAWSVGSLLDQTWAELEIVVVDDGSRDRSADIVAEIARRNPQVRLVRMPENRGAYAARNEGLRHARGEVILVQDADDWSHPQLIERCLAEMMTRPELIGVSYHHIRVEPNFVPSVRMLGAPLVRTFTTPLLKREALERLGGWDTVRIGADTELKSRLTRAFGADQLGCLSPAVPLLLALDRPQGLTRDPQRGTIRLHRVANARHLYRRCYEHWHAQGTTVDHLRLSPSDAPGRPCPTSIKSVPRRDWTSPAITIVTDLGAEARVLRLRRVLHTLGERTTVAIVHHPHPTTATCDFEPVALECLAEPNVHLLASGDHVDSALVVVDGPEALQHHLADLPVLRTQLVMVAVEDLPAPHDEADINSWDPTACDARLRTWLGASVVWWASSAQVRHQLARSGLTCELPASTLHEETHRLAGLICSALGPKHSIQVGDAHKPL